jgi:uncharacterized protein YndB with AHSA1/START domain
MASHTIRLHRVLRAPPERAYRAFLDPDAMAKWVPPHGFTGKVHSLDARVGGHYRMSFTNFAAGQVHAFQARVVRHRTARHAGGSARRHPAGDVLPGLARVAEPAGAAGGSRDSCRLKVPSLAAKLDLEIVDYQRAKSED